MKFAAQLLEMGSQIESQADPADGEVLVCLKVKVEDARRLGPLLFSDVGLEVLMRKISDLG